MGNNVQALGERIKDTWYITLRNGPGKPLRVFCQIEAAITRITRDRKSKVQLLLQVHTTHYILTFSKCTEAEEFSKSLNHHDVVNLIVCRVDEYFRNQFENNDITINS